MQFDKVAVIGAGGWGSGITTVLAENFSEVHIWAREIEVCNQINEDHINKMYLPNVKLSENVKAFNDIEKTANDKDLIIFALPSEYLSATAKTLRGKISSNATLVNIGKGFDPKTNKRLSEVLSDYFPENPIAVLSGPNHAEETGNKVPSATVVASNNKEIALNVQNAFMTPFFRVYTSKDVIGVEVGGALKNIIALATGVLDGIGLGDNTRAALMTRGLTEIRRLGLSMGARSVTFSGLSGIGDLIVTCTSMHSRNRRCGIAIGEGVKLKDYLANTNMVVEGVSACNIAYELSQQYDVRMPITETLYKILHDKIDVNDAVEHLMTGDKRPEVEDIAY
ncbi:MAG: NAD(P)H-dependent glycerol-3-phosphate dehydrogenase [Clostridia bacterium]